MNTIKIAPSILSADFSRLAEEIRKIEAAGADMIHIDVMDGHFVPNITIGPVVIKDIRKITKLPLDVHLMIENPSKFIKPFLTAGADMLTLHIEVITPRELKLRAMELARKNIKLGISLNPNTPLSKIKPVLKYVNFILVMSVYPGFGGQEFIPEVLPKISILRKMFKGDISVDGGINEKTAKLVIDAGANVVAAGSYIFKSNDYTQAIRSLRCAK